MGQLMSLGPIAIICSQTAKVGIYTASTGLVDVPGTVVLLTLTAFFVEGLVGQMANLKKDANLSNNAPDVNHHRIPESDFDPLLRPLSS
jgi:hypothetical protein